MSDMSAMVPFVVADPDGGRDHIGDWAWPMMGLGWVLTLLVVGLVVWLVVTAARDSSARRPDDRSPLDILEERFARGEIDGNELRERREEIRF